MKIYLLIFWSFLFFVLPFHLFSQQVNPETLNEATPSTDTILFDDFNTFSNQWLLGVEEDSWTESLDNGWLFFQSHNDKPKEDLIPVILNSERDFEIETSIQFLRGNMNQAYGLQFGKSAKQSNQYDFFISANGQFTIDKYENGFTDFVPFTESELVNRYAPNKLTFKKIFDTSYYYLNDQLVHQMPFQPFFGNLMGIQVCANSSIQVDYFKVVYLDSLKEYLSKILLIDYTHTADEYDKNAREPIILTAQFINAGNRLADHLKISIETPTNIEVFNSEEITNLEPGEVKEMIVELYPNRNYQDNKIKIVFNIIGADINNADDLTLTIYLNNPAKASHDKGLIQTYSEYRGEDPLKGLNVAKEQSSLDVGKYYALIIGIDNFTGEWPPLKNAVNDAKSLQNVLNKKYSFDKVLTLYNEEASRENILKTFQWLMDTISGKDNLLIYYSGHGYFNDQMQQGYWVPVDAHTKQLHLYISNEEIRSFLAGIPSKHTLLITDACFSGDIFRGKTLTIPYVNSTHYYHKVYTLMSRKALTSGGIEPVLDGGKDGHSVFGYYFLKALENNENKFMDASELYNSIKIPVINNSQQTPLYNPVNSTGDEGGQFIFIAK